MAIRKLVVFVIIGLFYAKHSLAESATQNVELSDGTIISAVKTIEKKLLDKDLTILGITVGKSNLTDVKNIFKVGEIHHEGDAGASTYVLCYQGKDGTLLAFESGEMGGTERVISNVVLSDSKGKYRFNQYCSKHDNISKNISIGSSLKLGITKKMLEKNIGKSSRDLPNMSIYSYGVNEKTSFGNADISSIVAISFLKGKASNISISKIESY